jgi:hypothetical protein
MTVQLAFLEMILQLDSLKVTVQLASLVMTAQIDKFICRKLKEPFTIFRTVHQILDSNTFCFKANMTSLFVFSKGSIFQTEL